MRKKQVKLQKDEAADVTRIATSQANMLIAHQGLRQALVIARLIHEKVYANYKSVEKNHGEVQ